MTAETITNIAYDLPLDRQITITRNEQLVGNVTTVEWTCAVQRGIHGVVQPGFRGIDLAVRWAQKQLVEEEAQGQGEANE